MAASTSSTMYRTLTIVSDIPSSDIWTGAGRRAFAALSTGERHGLKKRKSAGIPHVEPALAVERDSDRLDSQASCRLPGSHELTGRNERHCRSATAGNGRLVEDPAALILSSA